MAALSFTTLTLPCARLGEESTLPDLLPGNDVQNKARFDLEETDEIYEGYGTLPTAYPYRRYTAYTRELREEPVRAAVLENAFLRAVFLPGYGGRLWSLRDKQAGRELLYLNDVLRFSNLAVRDAWFAGGVEWNVGVIGHTPLTADPLFAAETKMDDGTPVLRLYGYERIRRVTYQMDFWLEEAAPLLNCRMRIWNQNPTVVPMYWWSNMAVPEYPGGRVLVPARQAYTAAGGEVRKVDVPLAGGVDISHYCNIPYQVDYFFDIPPEAPKFIANVNADGYGLLHTSTARLQSRKLFSWGNNDGSARWQAFLTRGAGRYLEIQAGLGKTQYGCLPMAPNTAWEWAEQYGPVQLSGAQRAAEFSAASAALAGQVRTWRGAEEALLAAQAFTKRPACLRWPGSGDALLENLVRAKKGLPPLAPHLDFNSGDRRQEPWAQFLRTGRLPCPAPGEAPPYDVQDPLWASLLARAAEAQGDCWHPYYQLGLQHWQAGRADLAEACWRRAQALQPTPWACYALAVCCLEGGWEEDAIIHMRQGMAMRRDDLPYQKEGLRLLARAEAWGAVVGEISALAEPLRSEPRILLCEAQALYHCGESEAAWQILHRPGGLEVADLRECEGSIGALWRALQAARGGAADEPVPHRFNFQAGPPEPSAGI